MKKKIGPATFLYPMPAVLIGALVDGRPNFMTAAWCGVACSVPPCISVAVQPVRHTFKGIKENMTFSVNVPSAGMAKEVDFCGIYSGAKEDKSKIFNLFYGSIETAPLIEECPINLECRVARDLELGSHILFIGEVVETHVSESCLTDGKINTESVDPLTFTFPTRRYHRLGEAVAKAFSIGKKNV